MKHTHQITPKPHVVVFSSETSLEIFDYMNKHLIFLLVLMEDNLDEVCVHEDSAQITD